jgi:hypothetical protein
MARWVIWSEEHGAWWGPPLEQYTRSLRRARRYTEVEAKWIAFKANAFLEVGELHEVAMPDPLEVT